MKDPRFPLRSLLLALLLAVLATGAAVAQDEEAPPPATIVNDEGGVVSLTGDVTYTNPFFTLGVAEPVVILEDQAGFVDRNEYFIMPVASQQLGQITTDFYNSPFRYSIALPIVPQGTYRDVDFDDETEEGVQVYAVAYWNNTFGDPYLEERDLYGGGWSTAYASTEISTDPEKEREIVGGKLLIYAPDDQQAFPSGFGADELLFTEDDPIVSIPSGYTVVDLDTDPFTFDRSRQQEIDLIEPEGAALVDLSEESYADAFVELVTILSDEYAFTAYKELDWDALQEEFLPRFEEADAQQSRALYQQALRDFVWRIPDGHLAGSAPVDLQEFSEAVGGGLGIAIRDVDDGAVVVNYVLPGSPAAEVGIGLGTEIVAVNGMPINDYVEATLAWSAPFSTEHVRRLQKLRYATRFPLDQTVSITFIDADGAETTETLQPVSERQSFSFSSFDRGRTGFELPVEYELLDEGYGYVSINSFSDNSLLTIQLWERLIRSLNENGVNGLIIDMRNNGGGRGFLADQMAAYFFDETLVLGNTAAFDEERGEFYIDPRGEDRFYLPSEDLRYAGDVVVLVGPNCASACEFFSYDMTLQDRATIIGQYPTAGLGASVSELLMPENERFRYSTGRALDPNGEIHIEGIGVVPDVLVPVTPETLFDAVDPIFDSAIEFLDSSNTIIMDGGVLAIGDSVTDGLAALTRVRFTLEVQRGDIIDILVESDEIDPYLRIYDVRDDLLLSNDDISSENLNAALMDLEIPADMTLVLEVASASEFETGSFTISINAAGQ